MLNRNSEQGEGGQGGAGSSGSWQKRKKVFIYGNYKNYYGYRIDRNVGEDPRLEAFKKQWFENEGLSRYWMQPGFGLIEAAKWNLRRIMRQDKVATKNVKAQELSNSPSQSSPGEVASELSNGNGHQDLLKIVSFRRENFVESMDGCSQQYDTILCLSVTKWIHLNWGDDGLVTLLVKIWRLLRPGGVFIMEPQPWSSYKNNRLVSEVAKENFNTICIYPETFRVILLDKIGRVDCGQIGGYRQWFQPPNRSLPQMMKLGQGLWHPCPSAYSLTK